MSPVKNPASVPAHWQRLRVLVVDDHCTYRSLMSTCLETLGVGYQVCADGRAALEVLRAQRVDLVITDCRMPILDGYQLCRAVRRRESEQHLPRLPVIALTASVHAHEIQRCVSAGMDACLAKPLKLAQLREVLEYWLPDAQGQRPLSGHWNADARVDWPTRSSLVEAFGSDEVVERLLSSLMREAYEDYRVLLQGQLRLDAQLISERLHRLVGGLAFVGAVELEQQCLVLMAQVSLHGLEVNMPLLEQVLRDICTYLDYLAEL